MSATDGPARLWCDAPGCTAVHEAPPITYSRSSRRQSARRDGWRIARSGSFPTGVDGDDLCPDHADASIQIPTAEGTPR